MLILHIVAGSLVLISGLISLLTGKGDTLHRRAGNVFFTAMVILSLSAAILEFQLGDFPIMGLLSLYFVSTSWATVKRQQGKVGYFEFCAFIIITAIAITFYKWGWDIAYNGQVLEGTMPLELYFVFGSIAAIAAIMDSKMILQNGVYGAHRIARHLWRMCIALLMAIMSFLAQDIFPAAIANSGLLWLPVLLLVLMMCYWLCRLPFIWRKKALV